MIAQTILEKISNNKALMEALYLIVGALIITVGMVIKEKLKKMLTSETTSVKNMKVARTTANRISELLIQMISQFDCDRTFYSLLHNGECYSSGEGIKKITRVSEKTRSISIAGCKASLQSVHMNGMEDFIDVMVEAIDGPVLIKTRDLHNGSWKNQLIARDVKMMVIRSLVQGRYLIGIVGVEFCPSGNGADEYVNELAQGFDMDLFNERVDQIQAIASRKDLPWYRRWF